jgi:hypothetical protein
LKFRQIEIGVHEGIPNPGDIEEFESINLSDFVSWGKLNEQYSVLDVDTIIGPVSVVPNIPVTSEIQISNTASRKRKLEETRRIDYVAPIGGFIVVIYRTLWGEEFNKLVEEINN